MYTELDEYFFDRLRNIHEVGKERAEELRKEALMRTSDNGLFSLARFGNKNSRENRPCDLRTITPLRAKNRIIMLKYDSKDANTIRLVDILGTPIADGDNVLTCPTFNYKNDFDGIILLYSKFSSLDYPGGELVYSIIDCAKPEVIYKSKTFAKDEPLMIDFFQSADKVKKFLELQDVSDEKLLQGLYKATKHAANYLLSQGLTSELDPQNELLQTMDEEQKRAYLQALDLELSQKLISLVGHDPASPDEEDEKI